MRRLAPADLGEVLALQDAVTADLPSGFVRPMSVDVVRALLEGTAGIAYGIGAPRALEAVAFLRIPREDRPNPVEALRFPIVPPGDWPLHAAFVASTLVLPAARGRGHQRRFLDRRIADARAAGMRWLCGGGHLANVASWRNLLARGFMIGGMRRDYGFPVIGLAYSFDGAVETDPADALRIPLENADEHESAFAKGYLGVRVEPGGAIAYERRVR
jgi:hypothetical protein